MKKNKWFHMMALFLIISFVLSACSTDNSTDKKAVDTAENGNTEETEKTIFHVALSADLTSLDPTKNNDYNSNLAVNNLYDTVLRFSQDGTGIEPGLASSWEQPDELTYVFTIRDDVNFWDGNQMTVEDVIYSLKRHMNPDLASLYGSKMSDVDSIEKTGDWEMTVKLISPDTSFINVLATFTGAVVEKAYVEEKGESFGTPAGGTMGTGPFEFAEWSEGSQIVMKKNENYWNKDTEIIVDELVFNVIMDVTSTAVAMTSGQIDFINMPAVDVFEQIDSSGKARIKYSEGLMNGYISFNSSYGPFRDPYVRKAAASAIDGEAIAQAVQGEGYYTKSKALDYDPAIMGYETKEWAALNEELDAYDYDLLKAKEYLAQSSYPDGFECTMLVANLSEKTSEAVQYYLKELNITVNLETVTMGDYMAAVYGARRNEEGYRDYDMIAFSWFPDFPDPVSFLYLYYSPYDIVGGYNMSAYHNEAFDELVEQSAIETGSERSATLQEAYHILSDDCPRKVYAYYGTNYAISSNYDLDMSPMWFWNFNFTQVKKAK